MIYGIMQAWHGTRLTPGHLIWQDTHWRLGLKLGR